MDERKEKFIRKCPNCERNIFYVSEKGLLSAIKRNKNCRSCSLQNHIMPEEAKNKIRNANLGKKHSSETREKMSISRKGVLKSEEHKKKISESNKGQKRPWLIGRTCSENTKKKISESNKGKILSIETRKKIGIASKNRKPDSNETTMKKIKSAKNRLPMSEYTRKKLSLSLTGHKVTIETKNKLSKINKGKTLSLQTKLKIKEKTSGKNNGMYGKNHSVESKRKIRLAMIKRIEKKLKNGHQVTPSYNTKGCQYFDKIMTETKTFIQHAENGGEYYIKDIGYWVDGYDKENNIVYEYDEKHHYDVGGHLKNKDIIRQQEIEKYLKCKFIRIKNF